MIISEDDKEIKIIRKKFNLSEEKTESLPVILDHYFFSNYRFYFDDLIREITEDIKVSSEIAKEIAISASMLLINKVKPEIEEDLEKLLKDQKINIEQKQNEFKEIELEILSPRDLSYLNIDERAEALDVFKNFIKEALISEFDENKENLNDRMINQLFGEGQTFKTELEKALFANQQKIGINKIILDEKSVEPTVANWITDFIKAGLIEKGLDFDKVQYFNQSRNFQNLTDQDKELVAKLLDLYFRLKNFPQSFEKLPMEDWYIIPYTKRKKIKFEKLKTTPSLATDLNQDLIKIYYQTLNKFANLEGEEKALAKKTNNGIGQIINELNLAINSQKLITALAALLILAENNSLDLLKKEARVASIFKQDLTLRMSPLDLDEFWHEDFNVKYLGRYLFWLLKEKLGMIENDAAVFALKLANILRRKGNSDFMKMAYGDTASQSFKFTE